MQTGWHLLQGQISLPDKLILPRQSLQVLILSIVVKLVFPHMVPSPHTLDLQGGRVWCSNNDIQSVLVHVFHFLGPIKNSYKEAEIMYTCTNVQRLVL